MDFMKNVPPETQKGVHVVVKVLPSGDEYRIYFRICQKLVIVRVRLGNIVKFGFFRQTVRQNIAQSDDFRIFDLGIRISMHGADGAATDHTDFDFFHDFNLCFRCYFLPLQEACRKTLN